jgi:antitoxin MazE
MYLHGGPVIHKTKIAKWGNSYAIRLPISLVKDAKLTEGQSLQLSVSEEGQIEVKRQLTPDEAVELIRKIAKPLPIGYKFNREEANARGTFPI